jgi:hypothetical protein
VDAAADLAMQVGLALEHAYKKGVVHGSLSPQNVELQEDGHVKVSDFGLSELLELVGVEVRQAASPYLAPERIAGQRASPSSDVYSLAAILYRLLANRQPQLARGEVLPPSRFNPEVPEALDRVVVKALAPDPANRYPDVRSFLAALGSVTLAPAVRQATPQDAAGHCPQCGAAGQKARFCRKCGTRLEERTAVPPSAPAESVLDEPILITTIDVGRVEVGTGIEVQQTTIAQPISVATGEQAEMFPEPLPMPEVDFHVLEGGSGDELLMAMPELPSMPTVDWAEIAPPMPEVPTIEDIPVGEEND